MLGIERGCELEIAPGLGGQDHLLLERDGTAVGRFVGGWSLAHRDLGASERRSAHRVPRPGGRRLCRRVGDHMPQIERRNVLGLEPRCVGVGHIARDNGIALARMGEPGCRKCEDEHSAEHG